MASHENAPSRRRPRSTSRRARPRRQHFFERARERVDVERVDEPRRVVGDLGKRARPRGDDGHVVLPRLEHREPEPLVERRIGEHARGRRAARPVRRRRRSPSCAPAPSSRQGEPRSRRARARRRDRRARRGRASRRVVAPRPRRTPAPGAGGSSAARACRARGSNGASRSRPRRWRRSGVARASPAARCTPRRACLEQRAGFDGDVLGERVDPTAGSRRLAARPDRTRQRSASSALARSRTSSRGR